MKTIKKLSILAVVIILAAVSFVPSTFSWYNHNTSSAGYKINYDANLPVSVKSAAEDISMTTYEADANGAATTTSVSAINIPYDAETHNAVKYYKTTFTNNGSNDVYIDFYAEKMPNNADFIIGTISPTINEKAYASRPVRTKTSSTFVRVYFKTHSNMSSYWSQSNYDKRLVNEKGTYQIDANGNLTKTEITSDDNKPGSSYQQDDDTGTNNDINISFTVEGREYQAKMLKCPDADTVNNDNTGLTSVFYYDLPTNTTSFFFFNHWYLASDSNREWNRTIDITDLTSGRLYYLNGEKVDEKYKAYSVRDVNTNLVALNFYYSYVRMSLGNSVFADIGLKKESDDENFVSEYYGSEITYSISDTSVATINGDGVITPKAEGTTRITTTIKGVFGDTKSIYTSLDIPKDIAQVPIITNVKIPAKDGDTLGSAEVLWYAINKSSDSDEMPAMTTTNLFYSI